MHRIITASLLWVVSGGDVSMAQNPSTVTVSEAQNNQDIHVKLGQRVVVSLPVQFGTGYSWKTHGQRTDAALRMIGDSVQHGKHGISPGGVEMQQFSFLVISRGTAALEYDYVQPWKSDVEPAKRFSVKVVVDDKQ
jgi:predicted secreted protein